MKDIKFFLKRLVWALLAVLFFVFTVIFAVDFYHATSLVELFKYLILSIWFFISTTNAIALFKSVEN